MLQLECELVIFGTDSLSIHDDIPIYYKTVAVCRGILDISGSTWRCFRCFFGSTCQVTNPNLMLGMESPGPLLEVRMNMSRLFRGDYYIYYIRHNSFMTVINFINYYYLILFAYRHCVLLWSVFRSSWVRTHTSLAHFEPTKPMNLHDFSIPFGSQHPYFSHPGTIRVPGFADQIFSSDLKQKQQFVCWNML